MSETPNTSIKPYKGGGKRNKAQKAQDAMLISELSIKGRSQREIAAELNALPDRTYTLSYTQIGTDLKAVREEWKREAVAMQDASKAQILRTLNRQESELWKQWEKSCQDATKRSLVEEDAIKAEAMAAAAQPVKRGPGRPRLRRVESQSQTGDPSIMRLILDIQREKAKILAIYDPMKVELTGANGAPMATTSLVATRTLSEAELPPDEMRGLLAELLSAEDKAAALAQKEDAA